jgi:hypothetical protein
MMAAVFKIDSRPLQVYLLVQFLLFPYANKYTWKGRESILKTAAIITEEQQFS